ncbi:MAG: hypothetical protein EXR08_04740 [Alphaproteobacteria bacterium]|nr:hypothetical protein [Alphaproteobacteria bacterium]
MTDEYIYRIRSRIAEIERELQRIQALEDELEELRVAERVLGRFGSISEVAINDRKQPRKQSIGDQIVQVLGFYGPLRAGAITQKLDEIRGSETRKLTVNVTLSRLKATKRIDYDGKRWFVIEGDEAPAVQPAGASSGRGDTLPIERLRLIPKP